MSETDFNIITRPEINDITEINQINRWYFECEPPLFDPEIMDSEYMLNWFVCTIDNRYIFKGKIREGYVYQQLSNNNIPSLTMVRDFIKEQLTLQENFAEDCVFVPYPRIIRNMYSNLTNLLGNSDFDTNILNESFLQELERVINLKKPTSQETLEKLEILNLDENFIHQYLKDNPEIKTEIVITEDMTDMEINNKIISDWKENNKGISCAMCQETIKYNEKMIKLPCKNSLGKDTPHYFHYVEQDVEGKPKEGSPCIGLGLIEWLKEHNTCPCCRFELPIEETLNTSNVQNSENLTASLLDNNSGQNSVTHQSNLISTNNISPNPLPDYYTLITQLFPNNFQNNNIINNNIINNNILNQCQCARCVEERERLENMNENELLEDQLLRESIRRSENINDSTVNNLNRNIEGENGIMMTEEEAIEQAILLSLQENNN